jgi:site-specific DNA-methyltransferase (adenine-specific)
MRIETIGNATLYLGDCLSILPELSGINAVVTDPPYGIKYEHKTLGGIVGDESPPDLSPFLKIGDKHLFWGGHHFADQLPRQTRWLMWLKHDPGLFGKRNHAPFDLAWTDFGGSARAYKHIWDASIREGEWFGQKNVHPHQKPTEVMAWCMSFIPESKVILDPYMGSGSTGVACASLGKSFIGVEIEQKYFDVACERIEAAQAQGRLFA